jgi:hypothetical protein
MNSKLPFPIEISDLRFSRGNNLPGYAVLEFDAPANPLKVYILKLLFDAFHNMSHIAIL